MLSSGNGSIHVKASPHSGKASFATLAYSYPLKLMPPRIDASDALLAPGVVSAYMLTYGGGLVAGDSIRFQVNVEASCHLVLLTQGSTKVFRERPGGSYGPANPTIPRTAPWAEGTYQRMHAVIAAGASLFLLPAPVTCFATANYSQQQVFDLQCPLTSSLCLLDWYTSGRSARGESWAFERYRSRNRVSVRQQWLVNDVMLLENTATQGGIRQRMADYACYATLVLFGPACTDLILHFDELTQGNTQYKLRKPEECVWSFSHIVQRSASTTGCGILRVAGIDTETVKFWLEKQMGGLKKMIGEDIYKATWV